MKTYRLALIGFGNVGQGLVQILHDRSPFFEQAYRARFEIVAVCTLSKGNIYHPNGLSPQSLLDGQAAGSWDGISADHHDWPTDKIIAESTADVIVELSYTDLQTAEPALTYIRGALNASKHVITANKGPIALYYPQLLELARSKNLTIGVEGTVMSGTPAVTLGLDALMGAGITKVQGILNGTTNYILTQMENNIAYADALSEAQAKGYAEADPSGDVDGYDAAAKVVIIANLLMGLPLTLTDINRTGISQLTLDDIKAAQSANERWKLIGTVEKHTDGFTAAVKPIRLPVSHPLAGVAGATNAITYTTDLMGDVTLIGPGAGRQETGYAIIEDLLALHRQQS